MGKVHTRHGDWLITDFGLEHKDGRYDIARTRLKEIRQVGDQALAAWPVQLSEKAWCQGRKWEQFFVAFQMALNYHNVQQVGLFSPSQLVWCKRYCQGRMAQGNEWERRFTAWQRKNKPQTGSLSDSLITLDDFRQFEQDERIKAPA